MSATAISYGLIGVQLAVADDMFGSDRHLSCEHTNVLSDRDWEPNHISKLNFCPECGKPVLETQNKFSQFEALYEFEEHLEDTLKEQFPEYKWELAKNHEWDNEKVLCVGVGEHADPHILFKLPIENEHAIKEALRSVLEPFDLYDESSFGIHVVHYFG